MRLASSCTVEPGTPTVTPAQPGVPGVGVRMPERTTRTTGTAIASGAMVPAVCREGVPGEAVSIGGRRSVVSEQCDLRTRGTCTATRTTAGAASATAASTWGHLFGVVGTVAVAAPAAGTTGAATGTGHCVGSGTAMGCVEVHVDHGGVAAHGVDAEGATAGLAADAALAAEASLAAATTAAGAVGTEAVATATTTAAAAVGTVLAVTSVAGFEQIAGTRPEGLGGRPTGGTASCGNTSVGDLPTAAAAPVRRLPGSPEVLDRRPTAEPTAVVVTLASQPSGTALGMAAVAAAATCVGSVAASTTRAG